CTASVLNSAVYACFGILNIILSFLRVEFTHDLLEGEISGEAHVPEFLLQISDQIPPRPDCYWSDSRFQKSVCNLRQRPQQFLHRLTDVGASRGHRRDGAAIG
ncbi:hypothetical protein, partial [Burkholderia vietnamiensis]|uniref:hypothetical protein n=1 Tax=Burkholderia vietnamiensis TaxID=60552 RepID=UPI001CF49C97